MKFGEAIYEAHGIEIKREGQSTFIRIGGETVMLDKVELESFLDAIKHLERRIMAYAESQSLKKVVET